jgi:hypothetical protein
MKLRKNPKFIPSWENAPFDELERSPRGIKFRLKIEGVFFLNPSQICAWLKFTRFLAAKMLNAAHPILLSGPAVLNCIKIVASYSLIYAYI